MAMKVASQGPAAPAVPDVEPQLPTGGSASHRGVLDVLLPVLSASAGARDDGDGPDPFVFPRSWRAAALAWWAVGSLAAVLLVAAVRTGMPFMVELVLCAGLFTIPGLAVSRLLVRRSHPGQRGMWWFWLYGLRSFFVYGYLAATILLSQWVLARQPGSISWGTAQVVAGGFGAVAVVAWGLVVRDTLRHGVGGRDRSEVAIDLFMAAVVVGGAALAFGSSIDPHALRAIGSVLLMLRPADAVFGIGAGVLWSATLVRLLGETAGLRAMSVDGLDLATVVLVLAAPPLVALSPVLAAHAGLLWLTLPLVFLAVVLPGMIAAALMLIARVPDATRSLLIWLVVLLVVSTGDAWAQLAMALAGYGLPAPPFVVAGCANFGMLLVLPLMERRRRIVGFDRLGPDRQLRRWDVVPSVVGLGAAALLAQYLVAARQAGAVGVAILAVLAVLVAMGGARHYAGVRETRRLHRQVIDMTDELYAQSRVDPLTGLSNRRGLQERFPQLAASCARSGRPLSVAMIDLDHFKRFNDVYGHLAGDRVLCEVASAVQAALRGEDLAARFGGEELCLVLPGAEPEHGALLLERVRRDRSARWAGAGGVAGPGAGGVAGPDSVRVVVTFSAGLARWWPGDRLEDVLRRADEACYQAKAAGRDRVVVAGAGGDPGTGGPMV